MQSRNIIIGGDVIAAIDIALPVVLRGPLHQDQATWRVQQNRRPQCVPTGHRAARRRRPGSARRARPIAQDPSRKTRGPAMAPC